MSAGKKILFIDDDPGVQKTAELLLCKAGYDMAGVSTPAEAYSRLAAESFDLILLDLNFTRAQINGEEGLACLRDILSHDPAATVLVVTGHSGLNVAVQALRSGARNFIMKPWSNDRLLEAVEEALATKPLRPDTHTAGELGGLADTGLIIGDCEALHRIKALTARYAALTASVLVMGESGTGKSLIAQALHRQSGRSELCIHDAEQLRLEDLPSVTNATFVFEDIERLDPLLHAPLTRWMAEAAKRSSRVVATSTRRHTELGLSKSLLYALSTLEINLPPLRERGGDIELLAQYFARSFAIRQGIPPRLLTADAITALSGAGWHDNLHALRRTVERAVADAKGAVVNASDLDMQADNAEAPTVLIGNLERAEKHVIEKALGRNNFNISKAAQELGLTRQTLYRRMARHGL